MSAPSLLLIVVHSMVAALPIVAALMMQYIVFHHTLPWGRATAISARICRRAGVGIALTLRGQLGLRVLRFVTLVPVVLAIAAVLAAGRSALDATLSARPLAQEINRVDNRSLPLAILRLPRETEYGLHFYRNQKIPALRSGTSPRRRTSVDHPGRMAEKHREVDYRTAGHISWEASRRRVWIITG